jgi:hypothetical protein
MRSASVGSARVCDVLVGIGNADPGLDRLARIPRDGCEIAPLGFRGCRPRHGYRTVPGNGPIRRCGGQPVELLEPADEAAIDDRDAVDEQQIGEPKGTGFLIEDRQVVVGMSRVVRPQREPPATQIKIELVGNQHRRHHDLGAIRFIAEGAAQPADVIVAALGKGARQFGVPDKIGAVVAEGRGPEDMVGMDVGQNHISDRLIRTRADRCAQPASLREAAAGVDDCHGLIANDKADIGDRVFVCG